MRSTALALALFALVAAAEEPRITFQFENESAKKVCEVIATFAGIEVTLDPEYAEATVSLDMKNASIADTLAAMAKQLGAQVHGTRILPKWKRDYLVKLDAARAYEIEWQAGDITFHGAIQYFRSVTGLNFAMDQALLKDKSDLEIELHVDGVSVRQILDLLTEPNEMAWDLRYGAIFISTKNRLKKLPALPPWSDELLDKRTVDLPFDGTAFPQTLNFLAAAAGARFAIAPADKDTVESIEITLSVSNVRVGDALALMLLPHGLTMKRNEDGVYVVSVGA